MLTSILASLSSFAGGLLGGLGLNTAAAAVTSSSVSGTVVAGAGFLIFSRVLGNIMSKLIKWFSIFLLGMFLYRHIQLFHNVVDTICDCVDTYLPSIISSVESAIQQ